ncbi:MAG: WbqC family protein [Bacteroidales bacterium]|nr:WbqC family protein [Bacteroidales bacterium]
MRVAISQPTYLPWMGYFGLLDSVDLFVFFDDVQYSQSEWSNRNKIKNPFTDDWIWLTVPVVYGGHHTMINQMIIDNSTDWKKKHWQSIFHFYSKTKHFSEYKDEIKTIYDRDWKGLCEINIAIIKIISKMLKIKIPEYICASELTDVSGNKTDRLISILEKIKANEYLSVTGTKKYIEPQKFVERNIKLYWFDYNHPTYEQAGKFFSSHMSVLDLLFNCGSDSLKHIRDGLQGAITAVGQ